ncbi:MAG: hypothetical protein ACW99Q_28135, partial [Candidatus Kariarchaeaceae archaeon]
YRKELIELFIAFPDYRLEIYKLISEKNEVWLYGLQYGRQDKPFLAFQLVGKLLKWRYSLFMRSRMEKLLKKLS